MSVAAHGIEVELPSGWDGRIYGRPRLAEGPSPRSVLPGFDGSVEGRIATLHAASFPLTGAEGDFGADATIRMPERAGFLALVEYQTDENLVPGTGLFSDPVAPRSLDPSEFSPETMMVHRRDQAGLQRFFTVGERPFCLYAVIGSRRHGPPAIAGMNQVLGSLVIV
jgi:hypothetical protein